MQGRQTMLKNLFLLPFFVLTAHAVADDALPPVTLYSPFALLVLITRTICVKTASP